MKKTGAQALMECLKREGVDTIFGYPGGAVIPIYDTLTQFPEIKHVLVRHEQGAGHMAEGYALATGKVGVCLATSGPGATNLVTPLTDAMMDSVPLVAITGQVKTFAIGTDAFQEADITGITMPITKHNWLIRDVTKLPEIVAEAFHIARSGRPGPVLIDVPRDIAEAVFDYEPAGEVEIPTYKPTVKGHIGQIKKAAEFIAQAERPILYVGGGAIYSGAEHEIAELAERIDTPVTTTLKGLGAFPETDPLSLGMLGMHGTAYANYAVSECDLLIAVGARFDDRVTGKASEWVKNAKIIHIDIDPAEIGKVLTPDVPIVGDVKAILAELLKVVQPAKHPDWNARIAQWKADYPLHYPNDGVLHGQYVIEQIGAVTGHDAIVVTDVGQHQMWAAQFFKCLRPRQFVTSGGLGTMGFGLPAAIGAQFARPDTPGLLRHRRRLHPDVHSGVDGRHGLQAAHQDLHPEQRVSGHGAPVAGAVPRLQLLARQPGSLPGLRETRRRLRRARHPLLPAVGGSGRPGRSHVHHRPPDRAGLPHRQRGKRLPDDQVRRHDQGHGRPAPPEHGPAGLLHGLRDLYARSRGRV